MKILLIGGTGVLSKDIAELAIKQGMDVTILNRGNRKEFIPKGAHLIKADIRNYADVSLKTENLYFDVVVDFLSYTVENLKGSIELFRHKCKQFIFVSSATAYERQTSVKLITENTLLNNKDWDYSLHKIQCEQFLEDEHRTNNTQYTIVRPYITYGDTRIPLAVISKLHQWTLIDRILLGKPVVMWDDGEAVCTLTHTVDFAKGVVGLFMNPNAVQTAFHITSEERLSWGEVLTTIAKKAKKPAITVHLPSAYIESVFPELRGELVFDKATNRIFDNTKIKKTVPNFQCEIPFEIGIERTLQFYQEHPDMKKIDYEWNARIDFMISQYLKKYDSDKLRTYNLSSKGYHFKNFKEKALYFLCRYSYTYFFFYNLRRVLRKCKKIFS